MPKQLPHTLCNHNKEDKSPFGEAGTAGTAGLYSCWKTKTYTAINLIIQIEGDIGNRSPCDLLALALMHF